MKHLFVLDPIEHLDPATDSSIALMREASARGGAVDVCEVGQLQLVDGRPKTLATRLTVRRVDDWYRRGASERAWLDGYDVVWMRKDPPFDLAYFHVTLLLSLAGPATLVLNAPQSLRDANEKLVALGFPELCPPSTVSRSIQDILEFRDGQDGDIVIKPLDGCAGRGVFRIGPKDENASALLEMSTENGRTFVLAQRYIPEVQQGDKRIILVEGRPVGAVLRVPPNGELRANLHLGAIPHRTELTSRDREICAVIGPSLRRQGVLFAGIDVIGPYLTEVNITSPTGLCEIFELDGVRLEAQILAAVESRLKA